MYVDFCWNEGGTGFARLNQIDDGIDEIILDMD